MRTQAQEQDFTGTAAPGILMGGRRDSVTPPSKSEVTTKQLRKYSDTRRPMSVTSGARRRDERAEKLL